MTLSSQREATLLWRVLVLFLLIVGPRAWAQPKPQAAELEIMSELWSEKVTSEVPELHWAWDPFRRTPGYTVVIKKPNLPTLTLEAVVFDDKNPVAIVNGKPSHLGDRFGDFEIVKIGKNFILVKQGESVTEVTLPYVEGRKEEIFIQEAQSNETH